MNSRLVMLLEQLLDGKSRKLADLAIQLRMTTRALTYHIRAINAFLLREGFPQISIHRAQIITWEIIPSESSRIRQKIANLSTETFQLTTVERQTLITLILLASAKNPLNEELAHRLGVSKSTIDKDFQRLSKTLRNAGITLNRHIRNGCQLIAEEHELRNYSIRLIQECLDFYNPLQTPNPTTNPKERIVRELFFNEYAGPIFETLKIGEVEYLRQELSLASTRSLLLYLVVAVVRIKNGYLLPENLDHKLNLRRSKEYLWAINICSFLERDFGIVVPDSERLYIAFLLTGVYFENIQRDLNEDWTEIQIVIRKMIQGMSHLMDVDFSKDETLIKALESHLNLTAFNLKHQMPIVNPALDDIRRYYPFCFKCLKKVILEVDSGLTLGISDDEIAYLVLYFSASLERRKRMLPSGKVAIICVHGAGTASLLRETLCTRFPNLRVVAVLTVADLDLIQDLDVDFIVSTIRLPECSIPNLRVDPLPSEIDLAEVGKMLMKHVRQNVSQSNAQDLFHEVVASINRYVPEEHQGKLSEMLANQFDQHGFPVLSVRPLVKLSDLLTPKTIQCGLHAEDWKSAVSQAAEILLESGDITSKFIDSTISTVCSAGPYIVISRGVALVHSAIGVGVNNLAMSLSTFPDGVRFNHLLHDPVRLVFCLAPIDNESHIEALHGIIDLFDSTNELEVAAIHSPEDIHALLLALGI